VAKKKIALTPNCITRSPNSRVMHAARTRLINDGEKHLVTLLCKTGESHVSRSRHYPIFYYRLRDVTCKNCLKSIGKTQDALDR
jgi:hypothetical protein